MPLTNEQLGILTKCGGSDSQEMATEIIAARKRITELEKGELAARERMAELERIPHQSCSCLHTTPCQENCTCINGWSSAGCLRCCSYGSGEQRKAKAEHLVKQEQRLTLALQVLKKIEFGGEWHGVSCCPACFARPYEGEEHGCALDIGGGRKAEPQECLLAKVLENT